jgi:hypothetical protein
VAALSGGGKVTTVVVLGTHRSGTSLVAGMLHALGVNMGPPGDSERWIYPNWANPTGQYENPEFTELLHQALDFDGEEPVWEDRWGVLPPSLRAPPDGTEASRRMVAYLPKFEALVRRTETTTWGWKQAWSMLVLADLLPSLQNPRFIVVRRDLAEVTDSLHRRDGLTAEEAVRTTQEIWDRVNEMLERFPDVPSLTVQYKELTADPAHHAQRLVDFLGLNGRIWPGAMERATGMVLRGPALRRAIRRYAVADITTLPQRYAWLLAKDLREHSRFTRSHFTRSLPREAYRILRAAV